MRVEAKPEIKLTSEKSTFPLEVFLPALILMKRTWVTCPGEEQKTISFLLRNDGRGKEEREREITASLLARVSWLMPPTEAEKISQGFAFGELPSSDLEDLSRSQYILFARSGFSGERRTLKSIGQKLGVSTERVRKLETQNKRRVLSKFGQIKVQTLTGEKTLLEVLKENLEIIFEEIGEKRKIPFYPEAPKEIWETVQFLSETAQGDLGLKAELEKETAGLSLPPPYDFYFARQVLLPLSKEREKMGISYFTNSIYDKFFSLIESFKKNLAEEIPVGGSLSSFLEKTKEKSILWQELKKTDFGQGPQATRVYNTLVRAGIFTRGSLLRRSSEDLVSLRQLGEKSLWQILLFLQSQFPEEDLTIGLERFLSQSYPKS